MPDLPWPDLPWGAELKTTTATPRNAGHRPPARPRGRPKLRADDARRREILAHAQETFLARGYAGTTTDVVAARCRMSKQTLYRLFPSKTALFRAMIEAHRQTMLDLPRHDEEASLAEVIAAIFRIDIDADEERARAAFIHLAMMESRQFPEIADLVRRYGVEPSRRLLAEWLAGQRARGAIRLDDVESGARMLMDMIFGAMGPPSGNLGWSDLAARKVHIRRCIDVFLDGVRARPD
jgi:AcrR family transcriptional regulator